LHYTKTKAATRRVAARMDVESTELSEFRQMKLLRRGRYCAPIAENKRKSAGLRIHLATKIHPVSQLRNSHD
jgi:hypothetical protein